MTRNYYQSTIQGYRDMLSMTDAALVAHYGDMRESLFGEEDIRARLQRNLDYLLSQDETTYNNARLAIRQAMEAA